MNNDLILSNPDDTNTEINYAAIERILQKSPDIKKIFNQLIDTPSNDKKTRAELEKQFKDLFEKTAQRLGLNAVEITPHQTAYRIQALANRFRNNEVIQDAETNMTSPRRVAAAKKNGKTEQFLQEEYERVLRKEATRLILAAGFADIASNDTVITKFRDEGLFDKTNFKTDYSKPKLELTRKEEQAVTKLQQDNVLRAHHQALIELWVQESQFSNVRNAAGEIKRKLLQEASRRVGLERPGETEAGLDGSGKSLMVRIGEKEQLTEKEARALELLKQDPQLLAAFQAYEKAHLQEKAIETRREKATQALNDLLEKRAKEEGLTDPEKIERLQEIWDMDRLIERRKRDTNHTPEQLAPHKELGMEHEESGQFHSSALPAVTSRPSGKSRF